MWRVVAAVRRNIQNMKKSSRVADENMFEAGNDIGRQHGWNGFSIISSILQAPISVLSCVSHPHVNGPDGVWANNDFAQISEMNHLMIWVTVQQKEILGLFVLSDTMNHARKSSIGSLKGKEHETKYANNLNNQALAYGVGIIILEFNYLFHFNHCHYFKDQSTYNNSLQYQFAFMGDSKELIWTYENNL